jgi:hypothetical protein
MFGRAGSEAVPAFYAVGKDGRSTPFIVSLAWRDSEGKRRIPPAVEKAIDRTVDATGREGLAMAAIDGGADAACRVKRHLERAMGMGGAIVLFLCRDPETAEETMRHIRSEYGLSLVVETVGGEGGTA